LASPPPSRCRMWCTPNDARAHAPASRARLAVGSVCHAEERYKSRRTEDDDGDGSRRTARLLASVLRLLSSVVCLCGRSSGLLGREVVPSFQLLGRLHRSMALCPLSQSANSVRPSSR
jgi:hypothetical protein